jgi:hypothetical protein
MTQFAAVVVVVVVTEMIILSFRFCHFLGNEKYSIFLRLARQVGNGPLFNV